MKKARLGLASCLLEGKRASISQPHGHPVSLRRMYAQYLPYVRTYLNKQCLPSCILPNPEIQKQNISFSFFSRCLATFRMLPDDALSAFCFPAREERKATYRTVSVGKQ
jgi:hypothetical protein